MGWASGSGVAENVWELFEELIPEGLKSKFALELTDLFESYDCDTMDETSFVQEYLKWDDEDYTWREK
jgi:hypothetical protein